MVKKLLNLRPAGIIALFLVVDTLCLGMGMGVPIFCILFGFVVGWYLALRLAPDPGRHGEALPRLLCWAAATAGFTLLELAAIWGRTIPMIFDPTSDFANFGHPFILYDPKASFVGWLVLMIVVSPFLQLLSTVFGADLTSAFRLRRRSSG